MTDKQLKNHRQMIYAKSERTEEDKIMLKELSCIDMINSILAYHYNYSPIEVLEREEKSKYNYLKEYIAVLGRAKVLELIANQIESILYIKKGVFTDSDGLSYNQIIWR